MVAKDSTYLVIVHWIYLITIKMSPALIMIDICKNSINTEIVSFSFKTSPSWDTGNCDGLVICWHFGQIRFYIFNYKDRSCIKKTHYCKYSCLKQLYLIT